MKRTVSIFCLLIVLTILSSISFSQSWKEFKSFEGITANRVARHPSSRLFLTTMQYGIYVSDDNGKSWVNCLKNSSILTYDYYMDIVFDYSWNVYVNSVDRKLILFSSDRGTTWHERKLPITSDNVVQKLAADTKGNIYIGTNGKIYKSSDTGLTWQLIYDHGSKLMIQQIEFYKDMIIATLDQNGVVISHNYGKDWTFKWLPQSNYRALAILNENEFFVSCYMELNLPFIYCGVLSTKDGGNSWTEINSETSSIYFTSMKILTDGSLIAGADYGKIYKSVDKGMNWKQLTCGMFSTEINSLVIYDNTIIASSFYSGVIASYDSGELWNYSNRGFGPVRTFSLAILSDGNYIVNTSAGTFLFNPKTQEYSPRSLFYNKLIPDKREHYMGNQPRDVEIVDDKNIYVSSYSGGIFHSKDMGFNWTRINVATQSSGVSWILSTKEQKLLFESLFDQKGLYQSQENNSTWKLINNSLHNLSKPISDSKNNYYTSDMFDIYKSADNCNSWQILSNLKYHLAMGFYLNTDNTLYATTSNGLYSSTDQGESWSLFVKPLPHPLGNKQTEQIAVVSKDRILVATDNGIYESQNCGLTWNLCYDELLGKRVLKFLKTNDGALYSVLENGVYKYELTTEISDKLNIPSEFALSQNYPNPFNPETTISYKVQAASQINLKVYDVLGNEVATLVNEYKQPGSYNFQFSIRNYQLTSGVYFYRLIAGNFNQTKKMILMK